jgi:hypothetical protein
MDCGGRRWASRVRQLGEVIELHYTTNTRFSGNIARDLNEHATESLQDVQNDFNSADTVLVRQGLETDLRFLPISHGCVFHTVHT